MLRFLPRLSAQSRTVVLVGAFAAATFVVDLSQSTREALDDDRAAIGAQAALLAEIYRVTLKEPLLRKDLAQARSQLDALRRVDDFVGADLTDAAGKVFVRAGETLAEGPAVTITEQVVDRDKPIGTLTLVLSTKRLQDVIRETLGAGAIRYAVFLTIIIGSVLIAFKVILGPIDRITGLIHRLAAGDRDVEIPKTEREDEIGEMTAALAALKHTALERAKAESALAERAEELSRAKGVLSDAIDNISEGFALWDTDDRLLMCNDRYREIFHRFGDLLQPGLPYQEYIQAGLDRGILPVPEGETREQASQAMLHRHARNSSVREQELGSGNWFRVSKTRTKSGRNVTLISDITERKIAEATIEKMALHDALTGLPNRTQFQMRLRDAIAQAKRTDLLVGVMLLDLDHFKQVNDTLGHPMGDQLLKMAAGRLRDCVRGSDTVARLGGDEFAVVSTNNKDVEGITALGQRIVEDMSKPFSIDGHDVYSAASIGITVYPDDHADTDQLLRNADLALYKAKDEGRGIYRLYDEEMDMAVRQRRSIEGELRLALDRGEFGLHYQPQIDVASGRIVGAEALIRWVHPERGNIPPSDFIAIAESTRLIVPMGRWVLNEACRQNKEWQDKGLPEICVSINASPIQFRHDSIAEHVAEALDRTGLAPKWLELEITEGIAMSRGEETTRILEQLRRRGVRLSIDDFGTGYSSLNYLKQFPVNRLKIDRSFVRDITEDWGDAAISSAVIQLGHIMNTKVIAEGVETVEQASFLVERGCDELQGYYFGKPMPAADFTEFLQTHDPQSVLRDLKNAELADAITAIV